LTLKKNPSLPQTQEKQFVLASVQKHEKELIALSDKIWTYAETAMREKQSSAVLADYAEAQGMKVSRGVAKIPTAFIAEFGSGRPIIGVIGEFDALPGLSQKAIPRKEPLREGKPGHGCGHNLFGAGSLGAAIAIKELIAAGKLKGTVRFYGTPAEEDLAGKVWMAKEGYSMILTFVLTGILIMRIKPTCKVHRPSLITIFHSKGKAHTLHLIPGTAAVRWMRQSFLRPVLIS
jgi:aminobenzoyl-glutamate utilization protein B